MFVRMHKIILMVREADYTPYCQQFNKYKPGVSVIHNIKKVMLEEDTSTTLNK